jgi:hypothetical protein
MGVVRFLSVLPRLHVPCRLQSAGCEWPENANPRHSEYPDSSRDSLLTAGVHAKYVRPGHWNVDERATVYQTHGIGLNNRGTRIGNFHLLFILSKPVVLHVLLYHLHLSI